MRAAEFIRALADMIDALDGQNQPQPQQPQVVVVHQNSGAPAPRTPARDPQELDTKPTMVPPLQQYIELAKAEAGKDSAVISNLTQSEYRK